MQKSERHASCYRNRGPRNASLTVVRPFRRHGAMLHLRITPLIAILLAMGCANPGPPKPPSLQLPAPAKDLRAERVGSEVHLTWTTSATTTDDVPVKAPVTAEICRDRATAPHAPAACTSVLRIPVTVGASSAVDPLPASLRADPVTPLVYRVRLLNARGRSADPSNPARAASGLAPNPITGLAATLVPGGVRLDWQPSPYPAASVLVLRSPADTPGTPRTKHAADVGSKSPAASGEPVHLLASAQGRDSAAVLDISGSPNTRYTYVAWRERSVTVKGEPLILRSASSAPVSIQLRDISPPRPPAGLEGVPYGFSVDLSWQPNTEPDLAGYVVERAPGLAPAGSPETGDPAAAWRQISPDAFAAPGFHDQLPRDPAQYRYRVSAVDTSGNRSVPSEEVTIAVHADPSHP